jgi:hypothetical protein
VVNYNIDWNSLFLQALLWIFVTVTPIFDHASCLKINCYPRAFVASI